MTAQEFVPGGLSIPGMPSAGDMLGPVVDSLFSGIGKWLADGARDAIGATISFISNSTGLDVTGAFGPTGRSGALLSKVTAISATLMVGFVFLAIIQALIKGEPSMMVRTMAGRVPLSVLGTVALVGVCDVLLKATDGLSMMVLGDAAGDLKPFLELFSATQAASGGSAMAVVALLAMIAALMVLFVLVVRSALIYVMICLAPVMLAARVWPAAAGSWRKLVEAGLALIFSKFAISLALALGAALLGDGSSFSANSASGLDSAGQSIGKLTAGTALLGVAAFMPMLLLKLIPIVEGAVAAQAITGAPMRGANQASSFSYHVSRLTGAGSGGSGGPGPGGAGPGGGGASKAVAGSTGSGGATGAGGAAASGEAAVAAGPAAVVVGAVQAGKAAVTAATQTAAGAAGQADQRNGGAPPSGGAVGTSDRATAPPTSSTRGKR